MAQPSSVPMGFRQELTLSVWTTPAASKTWVSEMGLGPKAGLMTSFVAAELDER